MEESTLMLKKCVLSENQIFCIIPLIKSNAYFQCVISNTAFCFTLSHRLRVVFSIVA